MASKATTESSFDNSVFKRMPEEVLEHILQYISTSEVSNFVQAYSSLKCSSVIDRALRCSDFDLGSKVGADTLKALARSMKRTKKLSIANYLLSGAKLSSFLGSLRGLEKLDVSRTFLTGRRLLRTISLLPHLTALYCSTFSPEQDFQINELSAVRCSACGKTEKLYHRCCGKNPNPFSLIDGEIVALSRIVDLTIYAKFGPRLSLLWLPLLRYFSGLDQICFLSFDVDSGYTVADPVAVSTGSFELDLSFETPVLKKKRICVSQSERCIFNFSMTRTIFLSGCLFEKKVRVNESAGILSEIGPFLTDSVWLLELFRALELSADFERYPTGTRLLERELRPTFTLKKFRAMFCEISQERSVCCSEELPRSGTEVLDFLMDSVATTTALKISTSVRYTGVFIRVAPVLTLSLVALRRVDFAFVCFCEDRKDLLGAADFPNVEEISLQPCAIAEEKVSEEGPDVDYRDFVAKVRTGTFDLDEVPPWLRDTVAFRYAQKWPNLKLLCILKSLCRVGSVDRPNRYGLIGFRKLRYFQLDDKHGLTTLRECVWLEVLGRCCRYLSDVRLTVGRTDFSWEIDFHRALSHLPALKHLIISKSILTLNSAFWSALEECKQLETLAVLAPSSPPSNNHWPCAKLTRLALLVIQADYSETSRKKQETQLRAALKNTYVAVKSRIAVFNDIPVYLLAMYVASSAYHFLGRSPTF